MKRFVFILLLGAVIALAACGGGEVDVPDPDPVTIDIEAVDAFAFNPSEFTVQAGAETTVNLINTGGLEHNFILVSDRTDPLTVTEANALGGVDSGKVQGGETKTFSFVAPAAGTYKFVCVIPGHAAGGMVGTINVTP